MAYLKFWVDVGIVGCPVCIIDCGMRGALVPIAATNNDSFASDIATAESKVLITDGAVNINEVAVIASDVTVVANRAATCAPQIVAETVEASIPLLKDDGLGLDFAYLLSDDAN